jgi:hypothetical protein
MGGMGNTAPREQIARGTLFPADRYINGKPVHLVIDTVDQDAYFIVSNKTGEELTAFLHREVEITGSLRETDEGDFIFNVKRYRLLDDIDQEEAADRPLAGQGR